jgi:hypothetical protein
VVGRDRRFVCYVAVAIHAGRNPYEHQTADSGSNTEVVELSSCAIKVWTGGSQRKVQTYTQTDRVSTYHQGPVPGACRAVPARAGCIRVDCGACVRVLDPVTAAAVVNSVTCWTTVVKWRGRPVMDEIACRAT